MARRTISVARAAHVSRFSRSFSAAAATPGGRRPWLSTSAPGSGRAAVHRITLAAKAAGEGVGVGAVARLHRERHLYLLHGRGHAGAVMFDGEDVGLLLGEDAEQPVELAGPVVEEGAEVQ